MREVFEEIGNIKGVRIAMRDGQARGFGHVEFNDNASAVKACKLSGTDIDGRAIRVDIAQPKGSGSGRGGDRGGRGGRGGFGGGRGGGDRRGGSFQKRY